MFSSSSGENKSQENTFESGLVVRLVGRVITGLKTCDWRCQKDNKSKIIQAKVQKFFFFLLSIRLETDPKFGCET